jgi:N-terminal domain of (some) glycogen debranching enzymes
VAQREGTRIISNWAIYANGERWQLLNGGPIDYYAARIFLTNKTILTARPWAASMKGRRLAQREKTLEEGRCFGRRRSCRQKERLF